MVIFRHASIIIGAIVWPLKVQVAAAVAAAASAIAAWRAAAASRDAVERQEGGAIIAELNELHARLSLLSAVLQDPDIDYRAFETYTPALGQHVTAIDLELPNTTTLWLTEVPDKSEDSFDDFVRSTHADAMREVENALVTVRHPRRRWWQVGRRPRRPLPNRRR